MPHTINSEPNNNIITSLTSITGKRDIENGLNDSQILVQALSKSKNDSQVINVSGLKGVYIQSDKYRPFTIFGKLKQQQQKKQLFSNKNSDNPPFFTFLLLLKLRV